ncbi:MAG TPA: hypothetical protein VFQ45_05450 [Longimicrobium sp.]|nr:hypothetical protein [Longimicrobium sp.]
MRARTAAAAALLLAACGRGADAPAPRTVALSRADTLVAQESGDIGMAADLAVDERGDVYVLDYMLHRVLVVPAEGGPARTIGRRGAGPGELTGPVALAAAADSVRVADRGNGRVQVFTRGGAPVRTVPVAERFMGSGSAFTRDGRLAFPTLGVRDDALVRVAPIDGGDAAALGRTVGRSGAALDFTAMKREIARGRVPAQLRNHARAVPAADGGAWLVLLSEPAVERYGPDLRRRWRRELAAPEVEAVRARFFALNREMGSPSVFAPLSHVADAAEGGGRLWLLLDGGDEGPAVLLSVDDAGGPPVRVEVPGVTGARQVAVDAARGRLYLALASAELVAVPLPEELSPAAAARGR